MQYDEIINCPKSGGDLCYKIEVTPEITNYYSLSCGFWTNSLMKVDTDFYNEQMSVLPELYKDLAWLDTETELIWLPHTINDPVMGMVYAEGTSKDDWRWAAVKAILPKTKTGKLTLAARRGDIKIYFSAKQKGRKMTCSLKPLC